MGKFKVEKGVPIPATRLLSMAVYPFDEMVPGDSFAVEVTTTQTATLLRSRLSTCAHSWAKRHAPGAKFATRVEAGGKAVRIWLLTRPQPLNPLGGTPVPAVANVRVHVLQDDPDEDPRTTTTPVGRAVERLRSAGAKASAPPSRAHVVKGKRY